MSLLLKHQLRSWFLTHLGLPVHVSTNLDKSLAIQEPVFSVKLAKCKKNEANQSESYQLVRKHDLPNYVRDVSLESLDGKNELSITLQKDVFTESTLEHCLKNLDNVEAYLKDYLKPQKRIVYDFSSPNIAKPFHYGHLRSTIIGNCLSNIHSFLGHDVTRINYIGDVGKQFGFLSVGYELFGDEEKFIANPLEHLLDVYIKGNEECEKDSKLAQLAKKRAFELEHRLDEQVFLQWQKFREHSINYYKKMYERIGVNFDYMHSESMYTNTALEVVETLEKSGIISIVENNAKAVRLGANQETEIPLITKEGASLYLTRDIAAAIHRKQTFNFDQMNYVVERAQNVHFTNLKGILEHAGFDWYHQLQAVTFGRVAGMSTRRGKLVLLKDVLDEAKFLAMHHIISTKTTKINEEDFDNAADILGISAVIVNDLRMYRRTDYEFDWSKATQYRKTSGIMLQYSYSRLCNLQRNCDVQLDLSAPFDHSSIQCKRSLELLLRLSQFDEKLLKAYHTLEPCEITRYLFDLTFNIGSVYKQLTVKDQVNDVAQSRLRLFLAARAVLYRGMKLLGLKPLSAF